MLSARMLTEHDLKDAGFKALGNNIQISEQACFYNKSQISIGSNVRIDDFVVVTAEEAVSIGSFVHIGNNVSIGGRAGIEIEDYVNISSGCRIFSVSDDFSGKQITNPTLPDELKNATMGKVHIGKHAIIGANTVILPKCTLAEGAAVGACSLVKSDCGAWHIYAGTPAKKIKTRSKDLCSKL